MSPLAIRKLKKNYLKILWFVWNKSQNILKKGIENIAISVWFTHNSLFYLISLKNKDEIESFLK